MSDARPASNQTRPGDWLLMAALWLLFFALGHPLPFTDDLYFIGAAINLVQGGPLYNPLCPSIGQLDSVPEYFVYTPYYSYILAVYLKIFGISRVSLAFFQCLTGLAATAGIWKTMSLYVRGWFYLVSVTFCLEIFFNECGFRPDALGIALWAWGLLTLQAQTRWKWALSLSCLLLAPLVSPNLSSLSLVTLIGTGCVAWTQLSRREFSLRFSILAGLGALFTLLFLVMIDFQVARFITIFLRAMHQGVAIHGFRYNLIAFHSGNLRTGLRAFFQVILPSLAVLGAVLIYFLKPGWFLLQKNGLVVWLFFAQASLVLPALSSATGSRFLNCLSILILLFFVACLKSPVRIPGNLIYGFLFALYLFTSGPFAIQLFLLPFTSEKINVQELRANVDRVNAGTIYVDSFAADLLYDYRLPPNVKNLEFGSPRQFFSVVPHDFPPGSLLVASKQTLRGEVKLVLYPGGHTENMPLIGSLFPNLLSNPYDCEVAVAPGQP